MSLPEKGTPARPAVREAVSCALIPLSAVQSLDGSPVHVAQVAPPVPVYPAIQWEHHGRTP